MSEPEGATKISSAGSAEAGKVHPRRVMTTPKNAEIRDLKRGDKFGELTRTEEEDGDGLGRGVRRDWLLRITATLRHEPGQ